MIALPPIAVVLAWTSLIASGAEGVVLELGGPAALAIAFVVLAVAEHRRQEGRSR